ncbi:hypothetical protein HCU64_14455 [Methylobacterium sp. C25]|uniref:DUF6629 family protein n=1 Tax=Methylobacterium sp. C25 TaxID=2721622 RepID=UPI001F209FE4|nr:DUF6629 family protein [Methylobacterium sp. C25]MCE4224961.1 hypothetical protein [Methylobacterium sp. C25]
MCFSAEANFVAAGAIGLVGLATLRKVDSVPAVLFAATPLLVALHQFTEGFVWLGLDGRIRLEARDHFVFLFVLYAQGVLPLLMPLAVYLMEPPGRRRLLIGGLTAIGGALCAYTLYGVIAYPTTARVEHHSIVYDNAATSWLSVAAAYVPATCGALVLSSHRVVMWFGILNFVGVAATLVVRGYAFTSVGCLYAAIVSVLIFWQFHRGYIDLRNPNSRALAA